MTERDLAKMSDRDKVRMLVEKLVLPDLDMGAYGWPYRLGNQFEAGVLIRGCRIIWNPLTDANARDEVVEAMVEKHYAFAMGMDECDPGSDAWWAEFVRDSCAASYPTAPLVSASSSSLARRRWVESVIYGAGASPGSTRATSLLAGLHKRIYAGKAMAGFSKPAR